MSKYYLTQLKDIWKDLFYVVNRDQSVKCELKQIESRLKCIIDAMEAECGKNSKG